MTKHKYQNKHQVQIPNDKTFVLIFVIGILSLFCYLNFGICHSALAQEDTLEFTLDVNSSTTPLPRIFKPGIDLSGRGFHPDYAWPQGLAAPVALEEWRKDFGFKGLYRLQYNLWEIQQLAKDKTAQEKLLDNYEKVLKEITDAEGLVIMDIFGTPAGLGKALDMKSTPVDLKAFKALVKQHIRRLSCEKKYTIWYEVWNAPDLDDFFVGMRQEYLHLYRAVAEAIAELETEYKIHIPVGGPSTSWWFQNLDGNSIITPERSLIYELIRYCYALRLPLDFISWHGYTTDPRAEEELTTYRKTGIALIRDWLSYFHFDPGLPLIIDEWNYDSGANILPQRQEKSNVASSFVASRLKHMAEAGVDLQVYYALEDFHSNKEQVTRNVGVFWFSPERDAKRGAKSIYNAFKAVAGLGKEMLPVTVKSADEFVDIIATRDKDDIVMLIYNYADPDIAMSYISRHIASLGDAERKLTLNYAKSGKLNQLINKKLTMENARLTKRMKAILKKAQELHLRSLKAAEADRKIEIDIKNLKGSYLYQRYTLDASCSLDCQYSPVEEKQVEISNIYQETLTLPPYSLNLLVLKKKPKEAVEAVATRESGQDGATVQIPVPEAASERKDVPQK